MSDSWGDPIGWGDRLKLKADKEGGLNPHVDRIRAAVSPLIGSRNTFAKLFDLDVPPADEKTRLRAWVLLLSLGADPDAWGVGDVQPPPAINVEALETLFMEAGREKRRRGHHPDPLADQPKDASRWNRIMAGELVAA
jgi:hypothetical protein